MAYRRFMEHDLGSREVIRWLNAWRTIDDAKRAYVDGELDEEDLEYAVEWIDKCANEAGSGSEPST